MKKGGKVLCINAKGVSGIMEGKIYTIQAIEQEKRKGNPLRIKNFWYREDRFKPLYQISKGDVFADRNYFAKVTDVSVTPEGHKRVLYKIENIEKEIFINQEGGIVQNIKTTKNKVRVLVESLVI